MQKSELSNGNIDWTFGHKHQEVESLIKKLVGTTLVEISLVGKGEVDDFLLDIGGESVMVTAENSEEATKLFHRVMAEEFDS